MFLASDKASFITGASFAAEAVKPRDKGFGLQLRNARKKILRRHVIAHGSISHISLAVATFWPADQ